MTRAKIWNPSHEEAKRHRLDLGQVVMGTIGNFYPTGSFADVEFTDGSKWKRDDVGWFPVSPQTRKQTATLPVLAGQFFFYK